jgi:hypothetical protein
MTHVCIPFTCIHRLTLHAQIPTSFFPFIISVHPKASEGYEAIPVGSDVSMKHSLGMAFVQGWKCPYFDRVNERLLAWQQNGRVAIRPYGIDGFLAVS